MHLDSIPYDASNFEKLSVGELLAAKSTMRARMKRIILDLPLPITQRPPGVLGKSDPSGLDGTSKL
jgi:hypothetical protein